MRSISITTSQLSNTAKTPKALAATRLCIHEIEKKLAANGVDKVKLGLNNVCRFMRSCQDHLYTHHILANIELQPALATKGAKVFVAQHSTWTLDVLLICLYYLSELTDPNDAKNSHFIVDDFTLALPIIGNMLKSIGATNARYAEVKQLLNQQHSIFVFPGGGPEWVAGTGKARWADFPRAQGIFRAAHEVAIEQQTQVKIFPIVSAGTENFYQHLPISNLSAAIWQKTGLPFFICIGRAGLPFDVNVHTQILAPITIDQQATPAELHDLIRNNPAENIKNYNDNVRNHAVYRKIIQQTTVNIQDLLNQAQVELKQSLPASSWRQKFNNYSFNMLLIVAVMSVLTMEKNQQLKVLHFTTLVAGLPSALFLLAFVNNFYRVIPKLNNSLIIKGH